MNENKLFDEFKLEFPEAQARVAHYQALSDALQPRTMEEVQPFYARAAALVRSHNYTLNDGKEVDPVFGQNLNANGFIQDEKRLIGIHPRTFEQPNTRFHALTHELGHLFDFEWNGHPFMRLTEEEQWMAHFYQLFGGFPPYVFPMEWRAELTNYFVRKALGFDIESSLVYLHRYGANLSKLDEHFAQALKAAGVIYRAIAPAAPQQEELAKAA